VAHDQKARDKPDLAVSSQELARQPIIVLSLTYNYLRFSLIARMETTAKIWSDAELMAFPADGYKPELLQGEIIMSPHGSEHGRISIILASEIERHARRNRRGVVFDSSTGFRLTPEDLLSPDIAFVAKARLVGLTRLPRGFFTGAPDLVVEVLSPSDTIERTHAKMARYFEHGTRLAWIINPSERNALV
jgi:Uma2 family endonuclease